jgi:N-methylhydantoinase B
VSGETIELPSKVPYRKAKAGDRLAAYGPSGGGYGDPFTRSPESVLDNVLDGLISVDIAREQYGVVIVGEQVNLSATKALRAGKRGL